MNDAPERIWAEQTGYFKRGDVYLNGGRWNDDEESGLTGYTRNDIHDRLCAEWAEASQNNYQIAKAAVAERDALAAALQQVLHHCRNIGRGSEMVDARIIERCEDTAVAALTWP